MPRREDSYPNWGPLCQPMARRTDPATSHEAADVVAPTVGKIQREVLRAIIQWGPMHGRQMEQLGDFATYSPSTIRKRISELAKAGMLESVGTNREGRAPITIYDVTTTGRDAIGEPNG